MSMTIYAVKLYKLNNIQWVFDDPAKDIYAEAFVAGADTLIDKILEKHKLDPEGNLVLLFSTEFFPSANGSADVYKLKIDKKNTKLGEGTYYDLMEHKAWLCDTLLDYYKKPPKAIYFHIKGESKE